VPSRTNLSGSNYPRQNKVFAKALAGGVGAFLVFSALWMGVVVAANPAANLDQCANGSLASPNVPACNPTEWVNGNLGASKAHYNEGDSVPYRMRFSNLAVSSPTHTITIEWDTTKSGKHSLDYLTSFDRTVTTANPCVGVSGCSTFSTIAIPADPQITGFTPIAGNFTFYGANNLSLSAYSYPNGTGFSGDKSARISITFHALVANPVLAWGGHIATRANWGAANSAVAIPGSPYHMRLIDLDGAGGNQDRSLSADAVTFPGSITIIKDVSGGTDPQDFSFTETASTTIAPTTFTLDDDPASTPTPSNTQSYTNILNFIAYTFDEGAVSNWTLSFNTPACSVTSANGGTQPTSSTGVTINLKEGENVTCTFVNTHTVNSPGISTQVKTTGLDGEQGGGDDVNVANNGHVAIGTEVFDTSSLSGATSGAGGTVDYYVEKGDSSCTITDATSLGSKSVTSGSPAASDNYTFGSAGTYYFWVVYSGDTNNNGKTSGCSTEVVIVDLNQPIVVTTPNLLPNDSIDLSGLTDDATGTLYIELQLDAPCGTANHPPVYSKTWDDGQTGNDLFVGNGTYDTDNSLVFVTADHTITWCTSYSGDANNAARPLASDGEVIAIDFGAPEVVLTLAIGFAVPLLLLGLRMRRRRDVAD
jgi:hypothetical protein